VFFLTEVFFVYRLWFKTVESFENSSSKMTISHFQKKEETITRFLSIFVVVLPQQQIRKIIWFDLYFHSHYSVLQPEDYPKVTNNNQVPKA
jgi:hypothetical protein